jgi:hypothetical protein
MKNRVHNYFWQDFFLKLKRNMIVLLVVVSSILAVGLLAYLQFATSMNVNTSDYNGKVLDKWQTFRETDQGSIIKRVFIVEDENGNKREIKVSESLYNQVSIGEFITNKDGVLTTSSNQMGS